MTVTQDQTVFAWNDTQLDVIALVHDVCATHLDWTGYLRQENPRAVDHADVWKLLTEDAGLRGLWLSAADGGHGESVKTLGAVVYALAGHVAAVPVLSQLVAVEALLTGLADEQLTADYLAGRVVPSVAVPAGMCSHDFEPTVRLDGGTLTGALSAIPAPDGATELLLPAIQDGQVRIVRSPVEAAELVPLSGVDVTRPSVDVVFNGAPATVPASGADAATLWQDMLRLLEGMVAVEQAGLATAMLADSVRYATERIQFGRPICTNQAVRHQLAEAWINTQEAQAISMYVLNCLAEDDPDLAVAVAVARAFCADASRRTAETAVQIHGGMGFAWETPVHLGLKRAIGDALWLGTPGSHRRHLRRLVDL